MRGYANLTQYAYLHDVYLTGHERRRRWTRAITAAEDKRYARATPRSIYVNTCGEYTYRQVREGCVARLRGARERERERRGSVARVCNILS